jgi:hypothetical protein
MSKATSTAPIPFPHWNTMSLMAYMGSFLVYFQSMTYGNDDALAKVVNSFGTVLNLSVGI